MRLTFLAQLEDFGNVAVELIGIAVKALSCTVLDFIVVKQNETFDAYELALLKNLDLCKLKNFEINKITFVTACCIFANIKKCIPPR